jgi:hypothetical protein
MPTICKWVLTFCAVIGVWTLGVLVVSGCSQSDRVPTRVATPTPTPTPTLAPAQVVTHVKATETSVLMQPGDYETPTTYVYLMTETGSPVYLGKAAGYGREVVIPSKRFPLTQGTWLRLFDEEDQPRDVYCQLPVVISTFRMHDVVDPDHPTPIGPLPVSPPLDDTPTVTTPATPDRVVCEQDRCK